MFITFEGPDGAGKTTQLQLLAQYLEAEGYRLVITREPGGTTISDLIRKIILDPKHQEMAAQTEILLYAASRAQHVQEKIKPALEAGAIVLCDRFLDASIAYQGYGLGFGEEVIKQINHLATGGLTPERTYLIDIPPATGRLRVGLRQNGEFGAVLDRIEQKELEYHERVRHGFQVLAQQEKRILLLDGQQSVTEVQQIIAQDIKHFLRERV